MEGEHVMRSYKSILVPSVQQLVADDSITAVPARYIRPDQQTAIVADDYSDLHIPVIDLRSLLSVETMESELAKLHHACRDWGFFQLINHGISSSFMENVKKEIYEFFNLPMNEKKKLWQTPEEIEGFGQAFVVSEEQKLDWADMFFMTIRPLSSRKPHLFHNLPLSFRDTMEEYSLQLQNVAMVIFESIGKNLNIKMEEIKERFEGGMQSFRMNYYPPCPQPDRVIGLTPHSDSVALTILLQVNEVEGLQIRKNGKWVSVKPLPNAFIVNIGDILEIVSNDAYRSIEHRATVNATKERLSIAAFHNVKYGGVVGPAPSLITEQTPPLFKTITYEEYLEGLFSRKLDGKHYLDEMKIGNN